MRLRCDQPLCTTGAGRGGELRHLHRDEAGGRELMPGVHGGLLRRARAAASDVCVLRLPQPVGPPGGAAWTHLRRTQAPAGGED